MATTASRIKDYPRTRQGVRNLDQPRQLRGGNPMPVNVGPDERMISTLGGGALTALGLASRGWLGLGLLFAGGSLLVRGLTGHCTVNQAIGRNTAR
jgi:uncharacterized membrane protein